jgi:ABC-2 type transport system permease protein
MTTAVRTELFKLRTTRGPWVVGVVLAALAVAMLAIGAALLGDPGQPAVTPEVLGQTVRVPGQLVGGAALLLGLLMTTAEHRHRTVLTTRLAQPTVSRLILAKVAAAALAGAVLAVAIELIMFAGGVALLASRDVAVQPLGHHIPTVVGGIVLVAALHAVAGAAIGELLRNPALAIGAVLGWIFVAEGVVPVVLRAPEAARWLPGGAIKSALSAGLPHETGALLPAAGLALLSAYAAGLAVAGLARALLTDP